MLLDIDGDVILLDWWMCLPIVYVVVVGKVNNKLSSENVRNKCDTTQMSHEIIWLYVGGHV